MSHITTINTKFKNMLSLEKAVSRLGFSMAERSKETKYSKYTRFHNASYFVSVPEARTPVGVIVNKDGSISLETDFYDSDGAVLREKCGSGFNKVKQMYAVEEAKAEARKKGYSVYEQHDIDKEETIRLVMEI